MRTHLTLEAGWRFRRGDASPGATADEGRGSGTQDAHYTDPALDYDARPEVLEEVDGRDADARPEMFGRVDHARVVLKPWILPTGNALIADANDRHVRPDHEPVVDAPFTALDFDDSDWQPVTLPHDWAIAGPFLVDGPYGGMGRLESWGVGWYRREIEVPQEWADRTVVLDIDGAMSYATVWCNGHLVGGWPYGYSSWRVDLSDYLVPGRNQLAIRLDNPPASARWYPGAGLYRQVHLIVLDRVHVGQWGTQVTTPEVSAAQATARVAVTIENHHATAAHVSVQTAIHAVGNEDDPVSLGEPVGVIAPREVTVESGGYEVAVGEVTIHEPRLWGPPPTQEPHRYQAVTTLLRDGVEIDRVVTPFGVREIVFNGTGFYVNGERVPMRGVNQHHDLGALGAAFNVSAARRQLEILASMGVNTIRMAHNPPDPRLLDLTDSMGLLVIDEVFDAWEAGKTPLDFHLVFQDWHEQDLRAMIRRDRNHPSVVLWSVGNEVGEQYSGEPGAAILHRLVSIAHEEDSTRLATASMNQAGPESPFAREVDVISLNYQGEGIRQDPEFEGTERIRCAPAYPAFHAAFPDRAIMGSETASAASSRGVYLFPVTSRTSAPIRDITQRPDGGGDPESRQVSSYELHAVDFGSSAEKVFATLEANPYVAGECVWNGFDYLGEPTPYYSSRSSYTGIVDLAGFPKDRYYLYRAHWRPDEPLIHVLPHWTWPGREGEVTPVHVFTSGDEVELFVNEVSHGRRRPMPGEYRVRWDDVRYEPGALRAVAYRAGEPWAEERVVTAGAPHQLRLVAERSILASDGRDLAFLAIDVLDADGVAVPTSCQDVTVRVTGAGELVATDNGDSADLVAFPSATRALFSGRALAIVRATAPGKVQVQVRATGLLAAEVELEAR